MKILFIPLAICCFSVALGQIFNAGFENNNGTPLSEFTILNLDNNPVEDWMPVPDFNTEGWIQFYDFYDNKIAFSTSFYMNGEAANDWLITPAISLPGEENLTLYWKAKSYDNMAMDSYAVKISTTNTQPESFTDLLIVDGEQAFDFNQRTLDLTAYAGETVHIAFVNQTLGGYFLALDDLYVTTSANCYGPNANSFNSQIDLTGFLQNNEESVDFTVNWEQVEGVQNYDIGFTTFNIPVQSNGVQSGTSRVFENMEFGTRYQMFVKNADCGSGWMGPKSIFTPSLLPYEYGFEPTIENYGEYDSDGWVSDTWIMGINSEVAGEGEGYIYSNTNTSSDTNKWLYSYPLALKEGEGAVKISFDAIMSSDANTNGILRVGFTDSNAANTIPEVFTEINVESGTYQHTELILDGYTDGLNYIAFGNVTPATDSGFAMRIDNIRIEYASLSTVEFALNDNFKISPNPASDSFTVYSDEVIESVTIYNVSGKQVKTLKVNAKSKQINVEGLPSGVYIVNAFINNQKISAKLIKK